MSDLSHQPSKALDVVERTLCILVHCSYSCFAVSPGDEKTIGKSVIDNISQKKNEGL